MTDPQLYRPRGVPTSPGVYRFLDDEGRVLYVGKARNLRARLANYFQDLSRLHPRTRSMVTTASAVQWTVVATEVEALTLEYTWIKEFDPRFNVVFRDDKSYPYLAITMSEEFPRVFVTRGIHTQGNRYFGPYPNVGALRESLDLLLRVFPVRSCSGPVFRRAQLSDRPCLLGFIDKCSAPCVGRISPDDHRRLAVELASFMTGDTAKIERRLKEEMAHASEAMDFEVAARRRDDLAAVARVKERNQIVLNEGTDADVIALVMDELQVAAELFYVRDGRVLGQRTWVSDRDDDVDESGLMERLLQQIYADSAELADHGIPREVLVSHLPEDPDTIRGWLHELRGARVDLRIPQRGDKAALMETVTRNAQESLLTEKLRRGSDLATRSRALEELQRLLDLPIPPLRIECYDISHTQGTYQVGSMVVFEDGLPRTKEYRTFNVRGADGDGARDDTEALAEVLSRRFSRVNTEPAPESGQIEPDQTTPESFAYAPSLLVIDGGAPQVGAAARTLKELGHDIPVISLAKRLEEVWFPEEPFPVILPRGSEALFLLQRVRDEAHRFAITRHRARRSKGMTSSALDELPGVGPVRAQALLAAFGSVKRLRQASVDEIASVEGIGPTIARGIHDVLTR